MQKSPSPVRRPSDSLCWGGPPPLLDGEDSAAYDELLDRMCAAIKPADVIYDMYVVDVINSEWDVLRGRRLKLSWLEEGLHDKLATFLNQQLDLRRLPASV